MRDMQSGTCQAERDQSTLRRGLFFESGFMFLDWKVFLTDDGGGRTYLEWMIQSWGWTLSVAGCAYIVAMIFGVIIGTIRTLPNSPWLVRL